MDDTIIPTPTIIAETDDFILVNKPAGMLTHPTAAKERDTLTDWLVAHDSKISQVGHPDRPGIVHRLDKEASGALVIAKSNEMMEYLKKQFQARTVEKEYVVLVYGRVRADHGIIDFAIARGAEGRMASRPKTDLMRVRNIGKMQTGREAVTEFDVEKRYPRFTKIRIKIHTGRMHQIRVHMFAYGHPVVGDTLYVQKKLVKEKEKKLSRLFLHAEKLCFADLEGKRVCFEAALPEELQGFLNEL